MKKDEILSVTTTLIAALLFVSSCIQIKHPGKAASPQPGVDTCITQYIVPDYEMLDSVTGDLNQDSLTDMIIVLNKKGKLYDSAAERPLLILTATGTNCHHLFAQSSHIIYNHYMGGASVADPFDGIEINHGSFTVRHHGGMGTYHWEKEAVFKYDARNKTFCLDSLKNLDYKYAAVDSETYSNMVLQTTKDFGIIPFSQYNIYKEE